MKIKAKMQTMMLVLTVPMVALVVITAAVLFSEMRGIAEQSESTYYDHLYKVSSELLGADRDLYQAMMGATQYYDIEMGYSSAPDNIKDSLAAEKLEDYETNTSQAIDNINAAIEVAKEDDDLYTKTLLDGKSFKEYDEEFNADFVAWQEVYDVKNLSGDWSTFNDDFATMREALSDMSDITEQWATDEKGRLENNINSTILRMAIIIVVVTVIIAIIAIIIIITINKEIKKVKSGIEVLAGGDFVRVARIDSLVKDFEEISISLDDMRIKLKDSITHIISNAGVVDERAQETNRMIGDSKQMTNDINSAVEDIANGATSMAQDVMETNNVTMDMGTAVEEVLNAAQDNKEMGKTLYEESQKVQEELSSIREAGRKNDEMATRVSDSVGEMSDMVEKITSAADAIIAIASQTNLLSLNASIEAARAGEAGKGFAVVADEIKELAEQSDQTAKNITEMLQSIMSLSEQNKTMTTNIKNAIGEEAQSLDDMINLFDELLKLLRDTEEGTDKIVELVESLDSSKNTIMNSVESLSSISQENAASTEETSASLTQLNENMETVTQTADSLRDIAVTLQETVSYFKVDGGEEISE